LNNLKELDARHKNEISELKKEFAIEKSAILTKEHKEVFERDNDDVTTIVSSNDNEVNDLFNKLEEERKKNLHLEDMIKQVRINLNNQLKSEKKEKEEIREK